MEEKKKRPGKKEKVDEDARKTIAPPSLSTSHAISSSSKLAILPSFCLTSHITTSKVFPAASSCEASSHEEAVVTVKVC